MKDRHAHMLLTKALEYLEQGWCQGDFAQDENAASVSVDDERAICWCALGALKLASRGYGKGTDDEENDLLHYLTTAIYKIGNHPKSTACAGERVTTFNDASNREFLHIREVYRYAIQMAG